MNPITQTLLFVIGAVALFYIGKHLIKQLQSIQEFSGIEITVTIANTDQGNFIASYGEISVYGEDLFEVKRNFFSALSGHIEYQNVIHNDSMRLEDYSITF